MTEPIPSREDIRQQAAKVRDSQRHVDELLDRAEDTVTHQPDTDARAALHAFTIQETDADVAEYDQRLDRFAAEVRAAALNEAADAIEREQAREETEERAKFGSLDHETELQSTAVRDKAALLRRMADCPACDAGIEHTEHCPTPETHNWGCGCPSDVAAAIASCPGREMSPSPCRCPCYGCKHNCAAHQPATARPDDAAASVCSGFIPDAPRAPGLCARCGDSKAWHRPRPDDTRTEAGPAEPVSPRCAVCNHPKRDHSDRPDQTPSPVVPRRPWCHACNATCDYADPSARPDDTTGAR